MSNEKTDKKSKKGRPKTGAAKSVAQRKRESRAKAKKNCDKTYQFKLSFSNRILFERAAAQLGGGTVSDVIKQMSKAILIHKIK